MSEAVIRKSMPLGRQAACQRFGNLAQKSLPIFLQEEVLDQILEYSGRNLTQETGGFLLGGVYEDQRRQFVEIQGFLPAKNTESRATSLRFTHDTWAQLNQDSQLQFPSLRVVGWHHTHPGLGIFFSSYDEFVHRNFFNQPWQVAMVVDPKRQEFGFFQWIDDQVKDNGFVCVPRGA